MKFFSFTPSLIQYLTKWHSSLYNGVKKFETTSQDTSMLHLKSWIFEKCTWIWFVPLFIRSFFPIFIQECSLSIWQRDLLISCSDLVIRSLKYSHRTSTAPACTLICSVSSKTVCFYSDMLLLAQISCSSFSYSPRYFCALGKRLHSDFSCNNCENPPTSKIPGILLTKEMIPASL